MLLIQRSLGVKLRHIVEANDYLKVAKTMLYILEISVGALFIYPKIFDC